MKETLGLIAGDGSLPQLLAARIRQRGHAVAAVAHRGLTWGELESAADRFHWVNIGELGKIIDILKSEGVRQALFIGGVSKTHFFSQAKPDERAIRVLLRLKDKKDDVILRAVAEELEKEGIRVVSPVPFLKEDMAEKGCWTRRKPTEREEKDLAFGWKMAKRIGRLDIGQCIVVKEQMVLAVEALEGTDETIRRGGRLGKGEVLVVKICKPNQDRRLDLPVIGLATLQVLEEAGAACLAVEAGKTIVADKKELILGADRKGICLIGA
ncbi:MAG: UDP-2,3-diacylglucosamine diphosphatase LpxI [Syntrophaceae bacterium]|nr:UDP-2,3-diacylglucosamine diphosphatase LpxI [Syntrophaceae bacterium]